MSLFSIYPWWTWLVGTVGLGGIVALIIFAPAAAGIAERGLLAILSRIWNTRLGMALICVLIALWLGHTEGALFMRGECNEQQARDETAKVQAKLDAANRDLKASQQAAANSVTAQGVIEQRARDNEERVNDLQAELAKKPVACRGLDADGLRRLLQIAPR